MLLPLYDFHIFFKVCKPLRMRHNLTVGCLLVLNGSYIYTLHIKDRFTTGALLKFVTYYNRPKIGGYIKVLIVRGFLTLAGVNKGGDQLYSISESGIKIIQELNESYQQRLIEFCNKYNIEL